MRPNLIYVVVYEEEDQQQNKGDQTYHEPKQLR